MTTNCSKIEILVAGNYCHDTLVNAQGRFDLLGGSAAYISAALSSLQIRYEVAARVGKDFLYGDDVHRAPRVDESALTTHFIDDFTQGERTSILKARCSALRAEDVCGNPCRIGLACGVADEITPEVLQALRAESEILICDLQGLIRTFDAKFRVLHRPLEQTEFGDVITGIDFLKVGAEELPYIDVAQLRRATTLLITEGDRGCRIVDKDRDLRIAPFPAEQVDASGAGDCFVAGFAHGLLQGLGVAEAAKRGSYFGALAVQQVGVPDFRNVAL